MQPWQQQQQQQQYPYNAFPPQPTGFQPQPTGYLQSAQTGFRPPPQQQLPQGNLSFLNQPPPQQTNLSFLNQPPSSFRPSGLNPQQTGFPGGGASGLSSQPTGYPGGGASGLLPQQTGFPGGGVSGLLPQQTGFQPGLLSQPTGLMPQQTGFLRAQPTGFYDTRLQTMTQSFMPSNLSQPFAPSGVPQFNPTPNAQPLTQAFQSLLQNPSVKTPKVPWALSRQEKKDYDQIFRAWDVKGDGFITGEMAREVFGQSGLGQDDLMKVWYVFFRMTDRESLTRRNLSDVSNRGKLNLPEFHVAMGLIYRALNGNDIPDTLPEELVPASMRDIDTTVNFMRDLLKHESSARSNASSPSYGSSIPGPASKDATMYKHDDNRPSGYKPSSRHLDRKSVRYAGEESAAEIGDIRRQLANTSALLDQRNDEYSRRSAEDEELEAEKEDIRRRVRRIQEDIEYVSKGRKTVEKDEERRKLEREMLFLMHEKLPELERKENQREEDKRREERAGVRARDKRNESHGRYGYEDDRGSDWLRGSYDRRDRSRERERDRDRDNYHNDRDRNHDRYDRRDSDGYGRSSERSRDREYDRNGSRDSRPRSPPAVRSPPPAPPAPSIAAPPPPPAPTSTAAAPSTKNMTPEQRSAFIREQAQKRIQDRLRALGVESAPPEQPVVDKSVEERLEREKKEAEAKSASAEKDLEAREEARRQRLGLSTPSVSTESPTTPVSTAPPPPAPPASRAPASPAPLRSAMKKPAAPPAPPSRKGPPAPVTRAPAVSAPPAPPAPVAASRPDEDPEEVELRQREEARQKAIADRRARLAQLEKEEEEERKKEEALLAARQSRQTVASPIKPPVAPPAPAPPEAPAPSHAASNEGSYNPFRKPGAAATPGASSTPVASGGGFNPFFKPQATPAAASPPSDAAPPPQPPTPPAPPPQTAPTASATSFAPSSRSTPVQKEDEWDVIQEKEEADSDSDSDSDYAHSRNKRGALASALFGGILGGVTSPSTSRPSSTAPASAPPPPPPPPAPAPPAALANLGGGDPTAGRGALLSAITGGAKLRKAQTVDKSIVQGAGAVLGDAAPPSHINTTPSLPSPTRTSASVAKDLPSQNNFDAKNAPMEDHQDRENGDEDEYKLRNLNRQSVDWYAGLAADVHANGNGYDGSGLSSTAEEEEVKENGHAGDELDEFDLTKTIRVRSMYAYEGQRDVDLSFKENVVIEAHPAKDASSDWWYGTLINEAKTGWFPHSYVEEIHAVQAKALYPYEGTTPEELPFLADDILLVVDHSEPDWWKVEKAGTIFLVPASYMTLMGNPSNNHFATSSLSRSRSPSILSVSSSSSSDSVLSFWSSDASSMSDLESNEERQEEKRLKDEEKKRREIERSKIMDAAGLKLRREPPGVPIRPSERTRRRPPPAPGREKVDHYHNSLPSHTIGGADLVLAQPGNNATVDVIGLDMNRDGNVSKGGSRRAAPAIPLRPTSMFVTVTDVRNSHRNRLSDSQIHAQTPSIQVKDVDERTFDTRQETSVDETNTALLKYTDDSGKINQQQDQLEGQATQDAYARYEKYLASTLSAPSPRRPRSNSRLSIQTTGTPTLTTLGDRVTSPPSHLTQSRLTGLLAWMKTTSADRKSPLPMISGPISLDENHLSHTVQGVDDGDGNQDRDVGDAERGRKEGEVGKTWSSLVEKDLLDSMSERERKRQEAIFEFIATEIGYNRDLQVVVEVFYAGLMTRIPDHLETIFTNIQDLLLTNTGFLSALEQRQKSCRLYVDTIGDILEEWMPAMGGYMTYCVNQHRAARELIVLRESDEGLAGWLDKMREEEGLVRGLDLSSFLLIPMQRITRYPLLLKQILHYTEPDQDISSVERALRIVESIVARINEGIREVEGQETLKMLSEDLWVGGEGRLDLTAPTTFLGPRRLLKEGQVTKAKSGRKLTVVLCNDILVLIESRNLYRMPIPLHEVSLRHAKDDSFALKVDYRRGDDTIRLRATSARQAQEWVQLITAARTRAIEARRNGGGVEYPM
ncbi:hypothetical protein M231_02985 [Tremella mesenterica]|uniref:Actin cytoskeleton-regulatory complex protein PAN1 n=1 Tax=Tremella mesenterica TaxID=5217 RepID=A0A4Q1BPV1_TREME|nr:hypothetical protein M231_02985 [Tremella mesenterica]